MTDGTAPQNSVKRVAYRAAFWTTVGYGASQVLRLGSNILLARLLVPEAFGLMALVNTFVLGLNLFSDLGFGPNIVQSTRAYDPGFVNTAWTMQVVRGAILWLALALLAWPAANFYQQPELFPLLVFTGFGAFLSGFRSTSLHLLKKELRVAQRVLIDLAGQIVAIVTMALWAYVSPSAWALAAGSVASAAVMLLLSHLVRLGPSNRFRWDRTAAGELFNFGRWIFLSTALTFVAGQADRLIMGKLLTVEMLGLYSIAAALAAVPERLLKQLGNSVIFPLLAREKESPRSSLRQRFLRQRAKLLGLFVVPVALGTVIGDLPVRLLYESEYHAAAGMLPVLVAGIWVAVLVVSASQVPFALGQPKWATYATTARSAYVVIGLPLALSHGGIVGGVLLMAGAELPVYLVQLVALRRLEMSCLRQDLVHSGLFGLLVVLGLWGRAWLGFGSPVGLLPAM